MPACRRRGFTLIEVLVAMLVLGGSALAVAMLQLHALRVSRDGAAHERAARMASELAELRAEFRDGASAGEPDPYLFHFDAAQAANAGSIDCSAAPCPPHIFALATIGQWQARLARDFPAARALVCHDTRATDELLKDWRCASDPLAPAVLRLGWNAASGHQDGTPGLPQAAFILGR